MQATAEDRADGPQIDIREAKAADVPFIFSGWLKSYRFGYLPQGVPNGTFFDLHHRLVSHLLRRATVLVATAEDDPDHLLGFVAAEMYGQDVLILHYIYVKEGTHTLPLRGQGIASALMARLRQIEPFTAVVMTHMSRKMKAWARREGWVYNPYFLFSGLPSDWTEEKFERRPLRARPRR